MNLLHYIIVSLMVNICVDLADQAITLGKTNEYVALINLSQYYTFITDSSKKLRKGNI